ncbi:MAG TPA: twin-arginine translocase TatA/TatE family subunit [Candidatus Dormibacteraeota bacterium]|nr:twin-arginine translocase TatA/TatE family subunit [Candidatus Dormibacteraeota bacterium]
MGALSPMHLLLILGIAILILGPKRLPEAGEALGRALREFRDAVGGDEAKANATATPPAPTYAPPAPTYAPPAAAAPTVQAPAPVAPAPAPPVMEAAPVAPPPAQAQPPA